MITVVPLLSEYRLIDTYSGHSFFDGFTFQSHQGTFSKFILNQTEAEEMGLINTTNSTVYIGTDYWNIVNKSGRPAIQIGSKKSYNSGLFILDISHMPQGCGTWPAFWLCGPDWPNNGEIDIIEGVNLWNDDLSNFHTSTGCDYTNITLNMTGEFCSWCPLNCTSYAGHNQGCGIFAENVNTFGVQLNENKGGVFATQIDDNIGIKIWFWQHENIPDDIVIKKPDPSLWGIPYAFWSFGSWCTSDHVNELQIIFDLYYCGAAGTDSTWISQCGNITHNVTCEEFVMNNPDYFHDAYWLINYVDVYQQ